MNEFVKNGEYIVLNVPYAEVYLPYDIVGDPEKGNHTAYQYGEGFRSIGLFNIRFLKSENGDITKSPLKTFNYPNLITMYPSDKTVAKLKLSEEMEEDKYYVLKFYQGDIIMESKIQQNSKNCELFMNFLIKGKLPKGLKYSDLYFAWDKNFKINGIDPGVPSITLQTIISENCRSKEDAMKQFRKVVGDSGVTQSDYKVYNMVAICSNSSVLNSLIFERFGEMLASSLNMSKSGAKQNVTPLEKVLTM